MKTSNADTLVEIRDLLARIHDNHVGGLFGSQGTIQPLEMAALRDCLARLNRVIADESKP